MGKIKSKYVCSSCGYETAKWWGICPRCKEVNSLTEEVYVDVKSKGKTLVSTVLDSQVDMPKTLNEIKGQDYERIKTGIGEFDRILGGGIVKGSFILIGGDPGIGKSTILLQIINNIANNGEYKTLYVSAEESLEQIKLRAGRILKDDKSKLLILASTNLEKIEATLMKLRPDVFVIDSIQTVSSQMLDSSQGSVSQVKDIANRLMKICKNENMACFVVGHVTKDGNIAGPRVLEHLVDTVLYFEGDKYNTYRMIRANKNRFGSTNELSVFEMTREGLKEVLNPSKIMLKDRYENQIGTSIVVSMEGTRGLLLEIEALLVKSNFPSPRITATGFDYNRLNMLLAVLKKYVNIPIEGYDVYVNLAGGIKITEPFVDLGCVLSVASSFYNRRIIPSLASTGEVGLTGEIRGVPFVENRIMEAAKLGFKKIVIPYTNKKELDKLNEKKYNIEVIGVKNIREALKCSIDFSKEVR